MKRKKTVRHERAKRQRCRAGVDCKLTPGMASGFVQSFRFDQLKPFLAAAAIIPSPALQ